MDLKRTEILTKELKEQVELLKYYQKQLIIAETVDSADAEQYREKIKNLKQRGDKIEKALDKEVKEEIKVTEKDVEEEKKAFNMVMDEMRGIRIALEKIAANTAKLD